MTTSHVIGITITLFAIVALSIYTGKKANSNKGANSFVVAGAIMGTLVGGSSTVGTAQLAYNYGMSAWWWTLGSGIACLVLALGYAKPFHKSGNKTLMCFIKKEYGPACGLTASILSSLGSFINIISQLIAATAIIAVVTPKLNLTTELIISAIFMILYIIFGGTKGSGIVGILKMVLLYISTIACGILVLSLSKGLLGFHSVVQNIDNFENVNFYSLFARGAGVDLGACLSLILGVITTQSYAQAIFMANRTEQAVKGSLISAILIPPVGIGGILVGLYMRSVHPGIVAKTALTLFITEYMPPLFGGVALATLFVAVVGTGAGLALGIATVLKNDIIPIFVKKDKNKLSEKAKERLLIIVLLLCAMLLSMGSLGDTILNFAFMSMGLRGATIFIPLCFTIWGQKKVGSKYALASIISGPLTVLLFGLLDVLPFDPLFAGVLVSGMVMVAGVLFTKEHKSQTMI